MYNVFYFKHVFSLLLNPQGQLHHIGRKIHLCNHFQCSLTQASSLETKDTKENCVK